MSAKKILFLCPYPENVAPSQRLKFEQYYPAFREAGYELTIKPFISNAFWKIIYQKGFLLKKIFFTVSGYIKRIKILFSLHKYDIIYIHLWVTPLGPPFFEWMTRKLGKVIIYDIDDLVYLKNIQSSAHPLVTFIKGRSKPVYLIKHSNHIITCTPYLDSFVRNYNINSTDISSSVDTINRYIPKDKKINNAPLILGWSGSISTSKYFYLLKDVLLKLKLKYDFKVLVIGDSNVKIEGLDMEALDWEETTEIINLQRIDIGLYPLPQEEWVLGKSGLKAIQYMALGIPTVATSIGANFRVIENGISGFLVNSDEQWIEKLSLLLENQQLRKEIGMNARKKVEKEFSIQANKHKYLSILNGLC